MPTLEHDGVVSLFRDNPPIELLVLDELFRCALLSPKVIPEITDERVARKDVELALLSGMAHGNGTNGETVLRATVAGIHTLSREFAMVYLQILWNVLHKPRQEALKRLVMEQQSAPRSGDD